MAEVDEPVRWTVKVSKDTDVALRSFLAQRGLKKGDLSKFIERAVQKEVFAQTVASVQARIFCASSSVGSRPLSSLNLSICWSIAVLKKQARMIGAGPLIVIDTEVVGAHSSKPSNSTFMSSSVAIETPELPILPSSADAPITATDLGERNVRIAFTAASVSLCSN